MDANATVLRRTSGFGGFVVKGNCVVFCRKLKVVVLQSAKLPIGQRRFPWVFCRGNPLGNGGWTEHSQSMLFGWKVPDLGGDFAAGYTKMENLFSLSWINTNSWCSHGHFPLAGLLLP
ncbi:unnamed protein product [Lathyrus sativus]|nr:unnamed protein product [Lathyrus sativus]